MLEETEEQKIISDRDVHLKEAEMEPQQMNGYLNYAKVNDYTETITFDMEKTLSLPRLFINIIYYKR